MNPRCIVCGRAIGKRLSTVRFRLPQPGAPANAFHGEIPAREPGHRSTSESGLYVDITVATLPATRIIAQQHVNGRVIRFDEGKRGIEGMTVWDGESYRDPFFCRNVCAQAQGYASAQHGARFTWGDPT